MVRFVTGREVFMLPEVFEADVHTAGSCRRIQVRLGGQTGVNLQCHNGAKLHQRMAIGLPESVVHIAS